MPWLLSDGLSGFSDLLDDEELHRNPTVTLGSSDLAIPNLQNLGGGADQVRFSLATRTGVLSTLHESLCFLLLHRASCMRACTYRIRPLGDRPHRDVCVRRRIIRYVDGAENPSTKFYLQGSQADWLKSIISGVAAPQPDASMESESSDNKMPFPGFPAAGVLLASLKSLPNSLHRLSAHQSHHCSAFQPSSPQLHLQVP